MTETFISTREAGRRLGVHPRTVLALIHAGELKGYAHTTQISGRVHAWKVEESSIDGYVSRQRRRIPA